MFYSRFARRAFFFISPWYIINKESEQRESAWWRDSCAVCFHFSCRLTRHTHFVPFDMRPATRMDAGWVEVKVHFIARNEKLCQCHRWECFLAEERWKEKLQRQICWNIHRSIPLWLLRARLPCFLLPAWWKIVDINNNRRTDFAWPFQLFHFNLGGAAVKADGDKFWLSIRGEVWPLDLLSCLSW